MFRGTPSAFASDAKALAIAETAIAKGFSEALDSDERLFLYMPFEHQENADAQARSLELISALGDPELTRFAPLPFAGALFRLVQLGSAS